MLQSLKRITILFLVLFPVMLIGANIVLPVDPMGDKTSAYEEKFLLTVKPPFIVKYYLLEPENYDVNKTYPLVVVLHGASRTSYIAETAAAPAFRKDHPAFVVVPVAPIKFYWAASEPDAQMGEWFYGLPLAIKAAQEVMSSYNIDRKRTYIVGNSMGGFGVFGALVEYPSFFAAAVPVSGGWTPADADKMIHTPIWAFHSLNDEMIPASYTKDMAKAVKGRGGEIYYTEYKDAGHRCEYTAFQTSEVWDWLFRQSRDK